VAVGTVARVSLSGRTAVDELSLLRAAAAGDEAAFGELVETHRAGLRAHCYRMLGSLHDAEDALQDALLRAWRGLSGFEGRSSVRGWLYAIATNAAIDLTRHRSRRELPVSFGPSAGPGADMDEAVLDPIWIEPFPDRLLPAEPARPEASYEQREAIEIAFVVALQALPAQQRAVFLLREVLGFSAAEIAGQLGTSVAAATSLLQRARARVQRSMPASSQQATLRALGDQRIRETVRQYADALERGDADRLIAMLTRDATWSMPPVPTWFSGHDRIREFLLRWPLNDTWMHVPVSCNGQQAVACYLFDPHAGAFQPAVIDVLTMADDGISAITAFMSADMISSPAAATLFDGAELFGMFGLPALPESPTSRG
jgi:RNA polymerase sigma-70 factor, ECF subfamily